MDDNRESLLNQFKLYSDEELKEITFANGYTEEAEQVAKQILNSDRTEHVRQQKETEQEEHDNTYNKNVIGIILKVIVLFVITFGTIGNIYIASQGYEFNFSIFIPLEIILIICSIIFLGFSEIIQLLQDIKDRL